MKAKKTDRQRAFVEFYLQCWNASEAARRAGYRNKPNVQGARLIANDSIRAEIERRLSEMCMSSDEVLARLTDHARGDFSPFLTEHGEIDLMSDAAKQKLHLIKKVKTKKRVYGAGKNAVTEYETEIELHDPQAALVHLGRHYSLFTDKIKGDIDVTDWRELARELGVTEQEAIAEAESIVNESRDGHGGEEGRRAQETADD